MNGPMKPNSSITTKITRPVMPTLLCRKWRKTCWRWLRALTVNSRSTPPVGGVPASAGRASVAEAVLAWVVAMSSFSLAYRPSGQPDPRIEDRVEDVGDQVEQHDDGGADDQPAQHDVDVVVADAVLEQVAAHAVPDEDGLGDDGGPEQGADTEGDDRGQWDERVAQPVLPDGAPEGQALGAGQPHVVRAEDVEHRGALEPAPGGEGQQPQAERRQHEVAEPVAPQLPGARRELLDARRLLPDRVEPLVAEPPVDLDRQELLEQRGEPEGRQRDQDVGDEGEEVVRRPVLPHRADDADDDRQDDRQDHRRDDHAAGHAGAGDQLVGDRRAVDALAEVPGDHTPQPVPVAHEEGVVETQLLPDAGQELRRGRWLPLPVLGQRVEAGRAEGEDQEGAGQQHEDGSDDPPDREEEHQRTLRRGERLPSEGSHAWRGSRRPRASRDHCQLCPTHTVAPVSRARDTGRAHRGPRGWSLRGPRW